MRLRRSLVTGPAIEPVTLDELKAHLRVDTSDEDELLLRHLVSARDAVEQYSGLKLINQTWDLWLDQQANTVLSIPLGPLVSIDGVYTTNDAGTETELASTYYICDTGDWQMPGRLILNYGVSWPAWPSQRTYRSVRVRVTVGFGTAATDVPRTIREAVLIIAAATYENREGGNSQAEYMGGAAGVLLISTLPGLALDLLRPFRRLRL